jgi:hypothetical protein
MLRAVIALLVLLIPSVTQAEGRFALLIGNQAYNPKVGPLKNPHDDIALVGAALRSLRARRSLTLYEPCVGGRRTLPNLALSALIPILIS